MPAHTDHREGDSQGRHSRRTFMRTVGSTAAVTTLTAARDAVAEAHRDDGPVIRGPGPVDVTLTVNGERRTISIEPATTLLEALRLRLGLTGSKEICDRGSCGGCSVLVDGVLTVSCMMLAVDADGTSVTTVEGMSAGDGIGKLQECFVRHDALQCGYCTPGLVVACKALLDRNPTPSLEQIKRELCGNICRCGTYTNVFNAVLEASGQSPVVDQMVEGL